MTRPPGLDPERVAAVAALFGDGTTVDAVLQRQGVARFGASRIVYQHAEERLQVRIACRRDGREGVVVAESLDGDVVTAQRDRMVSALAALPPSEPVEMAGPGPDPGERATFSARTAESGAADRVGRFRTVRARLGAGVDLGGSVSDTVVEHVVADAAGLLRREVRTRSALAVVATAAGASSYGRALHRDAAAIDPELLADTVMSEMVGGPVGDLPAAPRVLLGPPAVATLVATFAHLAVGAREVVSGTSPLSARAGEARQAISDLVTLRDDATDPAGMPTGFDCQGATKLPVPLVCRGAAVAPVHDRVTAAAAGVGGTGHAVPPGWRFGRGPAASHVLVDAGETADVDLLGALDEGIWVQRVDYVRVLQPRQSLVTGTSRDATRLVRGGRVVGAAPQFRFTVRLDRLLAGVLAVGRRRERSETVFMESVVAPAILVASLGDVEPAEH